MRCTNQERKDYKNYGGRDISVCDRWLNSFENFLEDMGEKPVELTIGRKNNNGNYEPNNCKWETMSEQCNNKRVSVRQKWFYGYGPNGEMIIDNNQAKTGVFFDLNNAHISSCLLGKLKQHKGWTFQTIT